LLIAATVARTSTAITNDIIAACRRLYALMMFICARAFARYDARVDAGLARRRVTPRHAAAFAAGALYVLYARYMMMATMARAAPRRPAWLRRRSAARARYANGMPPAGRAAVQQTQTKKAFAAAR